MVRRARFFLGTSALVVGAATASQAQGRPDAPTSDSAESNRVREAPDSSTILRAARAAQATFERVRRRYSPRDYTRSPPACGEIIGRFCYWDDDSTEDELLRTPPPLESPRILQARALLLEQLDSASISLPADAWIAGIHVHYLLEAGRLDRAAQRARECEAAAWWCDALAGLVEHAAWRYVEADSLFARALATMPETERCTWTNLTALVGEPMRGTYRRASCADRAPLNERLWWLSDPLYLRPGNDRRTEHYARVTRARIHRRAASGYGMGWRDDLDEIVRRYGWPTHYTQEIVPAGRTDPPRISAYNESPSYHFLVDAGVPDRLNRVADTTWRLRPVQPRERYAPPYGTFGALTQQTSLFRRGDSVLVVVAYDASTDSLLGAAPLTAALITSAGPATSSDHRTVRHDAPTRGTLQLMAPDTGLLASIELLAGPRMQRARFGIGFEDTVPRSVRMSSLAFFDPSQALPDDLDGFLPLARARTAMKAGGKLGLFWELYGTASDADTLTLNVNIVREGSGWLRRAGERAGLVGRPARVKFAWLETPRGGRIAPRALVVDLTGLDPGWYRIEVRLTPDGEPPIVESRRLEIVR